MRPVCVECSRHVGHLDDCTLNVTPRRGDPGNPLLMDAIVQSDRHQTWTA